MPKERLQKYMARMGAASRRQAEALIAAGRVTVDGRIVAQMGTVIDPAHADVRLDGRPLAERPPARRVAALHKPRGVISSAHDPQGRRTVVELVDSPERLYPVGRLDYDSEGLILLTNDGALTHALTHPSRGVDKTYRVWLDRPAADEALRTWATGLPLDGRLTAPARVRRAQPPQTWLEFVLREGRNRQIRRMCAALGYDVRRLMRVAEGPIRLGRLPSGAWRWLSEAETARLRAAAGLADGQGNGSDAG